MKPFVFFLLSLLLGYASDWAPYYVALFSGQEKIHVMGRLSDYERPCTFEAPADRESICTNEYFIPSDKIVGATAEMIGFGTILSASEIFCEAQPEVPPVSFDDPRTPGRTYETFNTYQSVSIDRLPCKLGFVVRAWGWENSRRKGYSGGALVYGDHASVLQVKRFSEFFNSDIRMIAAFVVILSLLVYRILERTVWAGERRNPFEAYYLFWSAFAAVGSGFAQVVIPATTPILFSRISGFFSLTAHFGSLLMMFDGRKLFRHAIEASEGSEFSRTLKWLCLFAGAVCISPWFIELFGPLFIFAGLIGLLLAATHRELLAAMFSVLLLIQGLKLVNVPTLPHSHVALIFVALWLADSVRMRVRQLSRISAAIGWAREAVAAEVSIRDFVSVHRTLGFAFRAKRVTILELREGNECEISIFTLKDGDGDLRIFRRDRIPPVFAHVLTTQRAVWNVNAGSELGMSIKKGSSAIESFDSDNFSVFPVVTDREVVGAVAITDYEVAFRKAATDQDRIFFEVLTPYLAEMLRKRHYHQKMEIRERELGLLTFIRSMKNDLVSEQSQFPICMSKIASEIACKLSVSCMLAEVDQETRRLSILGLAGYEETVCNQLISGDVYALRKNEQGPIALTINRSAIVIVPDVMRISHVLHPVSVDLFARNETKSCCGIPITLPKGSNNSTDTGSWGIIWLESRLEGGLSGGEEELFEAIGHAVADLVEAHRRASELRKTSQLIESFVPSHIGTRLLEGRETVEHDHGYLLMVDLRQSSLIANELGGKSPAGHDIFEALVRDKLLPIVLTEADAFGLTLQVRIWDAFYFTLSASEIRNDSLECIYNFLERLLPLLDAKYRRAVADRIAYKFDDKLYLRSCVGFGDISRDLAPGARRNWTIVGNEMANITKLENQCKKLDGLVFTTSDLIPRLSKKWGGRWVQSSASHPVTGKAIWLMSEDLARIHPIEDAA